MMIVEHGGSYDASAQSCSYTKPMMTAKQICENHTGYWDPAAQVGKFKQATDCWLFLILLPSSWPRGNLELCLDGTSMAYPYICGGQAPSHIPLPRRPETSRTESVNYSRRSCAAGEVLGQLDLTHVYGWGEMTRVDEHPATATTHPGDRHGLTESPM